MRWLELTVETHPEAIESVSELLSQYAPGGVAIEEPIELIDEGQEYRVLAGQPVKVHGYLPVDGTEEDTRQRIAEGLWHLSSLGAHFVGEAQTRIVNEEDWANAWKDYFHVTHIGQRLVDADELEAHNLEAARLEARQNLARQAALHGVGLDDDEGTFHGDSFAPRMCAGRGAAPSAAGRGWRQWGRWPGFRRPRHRGAPARRPAPSQR